MQSLRRASSVPLDAKARFRSTSEILRNTTRVATTIGAALLITTLAGSGWAEEQPRSPNSEKREAGQQQPKRILVVRVPDDTEFAERIRSELQANGWRILETDGSEVRASPEALAQLAGELGATAAVRLDVRSGKVDIFIARVWGNVAETVQSETVPFDAQVLAMRTTEALRARGLELSTAPTVAAPNPRAPEVLREADRRQGATRRQRDAVPLKRQTHVDATKPASPRALRLEAAPVIIDSPGGLGLAVAAWLDLRVELSSMISLSAMGALPGKAHHVRGIQGEADVSTRLLGVAAEIDWLRRSSVTAAMGLGATAFFTSMKGTLARPGYAVADEWITTYGPVSYLRVGVGRPSDALQLFALGLGGLSVPEVRVAFGEAQVGRWGRPLGLFAIGIDWRFMCW